jgi:hypothetical protein
MVSVGVMETHFFIVMTYGAFVSKEGLGKRQKMGQNFIAPQIGSIQTATPRPGRGRWQPECGCF